MGPDSFLNIDEAAVAASEIVVEKRTGAVRQAGATQAGAQIMRWRTLAEGSLYFLARGILNCWWLTPSLHKPICDWLQEVPPRRKLLMIPRGHGKTTLVGQCLPIHLWIQPKESNRYLAGVPGNETRILMCGEKIQRAQDHLRVIQHHMSTNEVLRGLWPHVVWDNPRRQAPKWNDAEMIIPRSAEFPDPSIRAVGVEAAITGAHPNVIIKDDLTTEAAANSPLVMQTAIDWHRNSRALMSNPERDLEFITGTRWAVADLLEHIMEKDPTVAVNTQWRSMVEDGRILYPENFGGDGAVERLQREHGVMFPLLYMNSVASSDLVDFDVADLRFYDVRGESVWFSEDDRDAELSREMRAPAPKRGPELRGRSIYDNVTQEALRGRFLRRDRAA